MFMSSLFKVTRIPLRGAVERRAADVWTTERRVAVYRRGQTVLISVASQQASFLRAALSAAVILKHIMPL